MILQNPNSLEEKYKNHSKKIRQINTFINALFRYYLAFIISQSHRRELQMRTCQTNRFHARSKKLFLKV